MKNKVIDYINMKEYITAIAYFPTGDMISIGTHNGRCSIYDCKVCIYIFNPSLNLDIIYHSPVGIESENSHWEGR